MFGILLLAAAGAALLFAAASKPKAKVASALPLPSGAAPDGLAGVGQVDTTAFQAPTSKIQYWVTRWPVDANGEQFVVAQAVNNPQGDWVSFRVNPTTKARRLHATNPPPRTQARTDFNF